MGELLPTDEDVGPDGRVMEVLSEHLCQGWLEGYLLTGRHGLFSCYEAFIHIIDSMFNQHAKWLEAAQRLPWRRPVASLNYLLTSHVWRQDHNGFSHQDPGFIGHVANKKASVVRIYLPPDANTLLSVADHCLRSRNYVNVIVAGKQPGPQWLDREAAVRHCAAGAGLWDWASNDAGVAPDVVMACAGDVPTLETMAAVDLLRRHLPDLRVRVVNVVDLMALQPQSEHPHGLPDAVFDSLFTADRPVIFAFHGYPWLVHRLLHGRACAQRFHVHGYKRRGHHHHAIRHDGAERHRPLHAGHGRGRAGRAGDRRLGAFRAASARPAGGPHGIRARGRPGHARHQGLALAGLMAVLTLNAGSSSLKFALFDGARAVARGSVEAITDAPKASANGADGRDLEPPKVDGVGHEAVLPALFQWTEQHLDGVRLDAVGHRIVHGGDRFTGPAIVDARVLADIEALCPLAPLHQPHNVAAIRAAQKAEPGLAQVACFDTAFHRTMPEVARRHALPERLGLRRYGFHGLSYEWIAGTLSPRLAGGRTIVAHLGSGASLCALQAGRSIETTMSTTPLDGLVMGTRCGSLDAGVVLYLLQHAGDVGRRGRTPAVLRGRAAGRFGRQRRHADAAAERGRRSESGDRAVRLPHCAIRGRTCGRAWRARWAGVHRRHWRA